MRKVKKINGFLVVKFNDREKREYPGLGSYGVIDAECYTGNLDIDRGSMEYEDADSLEVAVEQARGLESEMDITEQPPTYTVVVEADDSFSETEVAPKLLVDRWEQQLAKQIGSSRYPDTDPRTAAHELYGFKLALHRVGLLSEWDITVEPDHFAKGLGYGPLPKSPEAMLAYICDEKCKERIPGRTQEELDAICARCAVEQLMTEADARELRGREKALRELNELITPMSDAAAPPGAMRRMEYGARQYLKALKTVGVLTDAEANTFEAHIDEAVKRWEAAPSPTPCCSYEDDGYRSVGLLVGGVLADISPHDYVETEVVKGCTVQTLKCRKCGHESYTWHRDPELEQLRQLVDEVDGFIGGEGAQ